MSYIVSDNRQLEKRTQNAGAEGSVLRKIPTTDNLKKKEERRKKKEERVLSRKPDTSPKGDWRSKLET